MHQRVPLKMFHPSERVEEKPLLELNQQRDREKRTEGDGRNVFARRNAPFIEPCCPNRPVFPDNSHLIRKYLNVNPFLEILGKKVHLQK